jgi:DUF1680 family protein
MAEDAALFRPAFNTGATTTNDSESGDTMTATQAVPFTAVTFDDGFWAPRQAALRTTTIPLLYEQCKKAGMIAALDVHAPADALPLQFEITPLGTKPATPVMYWDSDLGKWIEAAAYTLATHRDPALEALIDDIVSRIEAAQEPDGYFNTYFQRRAPDKKWSNLRDWHELYCAGHLIEGAVAYAAATGKTQLLEAMRRYVDLIGRTFGPAPGMKRGYCGHEEIELALVKLYRFTNDQRYLDLARYFVDERGRQPHYFDAEARARGDDPANWYHHTYDYNQSRLPVRAQDKVTGHAVRAMYLYTAMADLAAEDADTGLPAACERLWQDLTTKRLYVTGGLGPSWANEGFTSDYDLPNDTAYAETCAAVGLVFWAHRMLLMTGESVYANAMERALYNGAISGISLRGDRFFYENPLASRGGVERWIWHRCPCCPANIARLLGSLGQYVCSTGSDELSVHLYVQSHSRTRLNEHNIELRQQTRLPWDGDIRLTLELGPPTRFALRLRVPDWSPSFAVSVNGQPITVAPLDRGYIRIHRNWTSGDCVELSLAMPPRFLSARPELAVDLGRVAVQRGPFIYCVEEADADADVERLALDTTGQISASFEPDLLGGTGILDLPGWITRAADPRAPLYSDQPPVQEPAKIRAIPYPLWAHRGPGTMAVWLRRAF